MRDRKQHAGNAIPQGFPWPAGPDAVHQTNETQRACAGASLFCGLRDHGRQVEATCWGCDPMRPHSMGVGNAIPQGFPWPAGPDAAHPTNETQRGQERASLFCCGLRDHGRQAEATRWGCDPMRPHPMGETQREKSNSECPLWPARPSVIVARRPRRTIH